MHKLDGFFSILTIYFLFPIFLVRFINVRSYEYSVDKNTIVTHSPRNLLPVCRNTRLRGYYRMRTRISYTLQHTGSVCIYFRGFLLSNTNHKYAMTGVRVCQGPSATIAESPSFMKY